MKSSTPKRYIDLFSGCGGLSLGLHNAGWEGLFAIEKSVDAFETLEHNLINKLNHYNWPEWLPVKAYDINDILSKFRKNLIGLRGSVDMVAGGPPCQGFSMAGRRKEDDSRNKLINSYISFIKLVKPKIIFFENVRGFTISFKDNADRGKIYSEHVIKALDKAGYNVQGKLVDFSNYGIPQKRTRFILVGIKKSIDSDNSITNIFFENINDSKSEFLKTKGLNIPVSLEEAISDLLEKNGTVESPDSKNFKAGKYSKAITKYQQLMRCRKYKGTVPDSHRFVNHSKKIQERFQYAIDNELGPKEYQLYFNLSKSGTKKLLGDEPTSTLTTLPDDYIHYCEPRILTVREYARIQSFPDSYEFKGRYTTGGKFRVQEVPRYSQVGNAIPPLFVEQCGCVLKELI